MIITNGTHTLHIRPKKVEQPRRRNAARTHVGDSEQEDRKGIGKARPIRDSEGRAGRYPNGGGLMLCVCLAK